MKIEAGKYYRTRDGQKVGPMQVPPGSMWSDTVESSTRTDDGRNRGWLKGGRYFSEEESDLDLIAEWTDTPDLTAITTPFGLLDEVYGPGTREALKAHGGPWELWAGGDEWIAMEDPDWVASLVYRVKPQPPTPRELWMRVNQNGDWRNCAEDAEGARLFREVTD